MSGSGSEVVDALVALFEPSETDVAAQTAYTTVIALTFVWAGALFGLGFLSRRRERRAGARRAARNAIKAPAKLGHRARGGDADNFREVLTLLLLDSKAHLDALDEEVAAVSRGQGLKALARVQHFEQRYDVVRCFRALALTLQEAFVAQTRHGLVSQAALHPALDRLAELAPVVAAELGAGRGASTDRMQALTRKLHRVCSRLPPYIRHVGDDDGGAAAAGTFIVLAKRRMRWPIESAEFQAVEARMQRHLALFDHSEDDHALASEHAASKRLAHLPARLRRYPAFYTVLLGLYFAVFMAFAVNAGSGRLGGLFGTFLEIPPQYATKLIVDPDNAGKVIQDAQTLVVPIQKLLLPLLFGVMHWVLLSLALLPFGMLRGFTRDAVRACPGVRRWVPVDDMEFLHRGMGFVALGGLLAGGLIWAIMMGASCSGAAAAGSVRVEDLAVPPGLAVVDGQIAGTLPAGCDGALLRETNGTTLRCTRTVSEKESSCLAFNPVIFDAKKGQKFKGDVISKELLFDSFGGELEASFFDPRDNVLYLRCLAWPIWLFMLPAILWAYTPAPACLPAFAKRWWFEICYYSHVLGAWITVLAALYARFEVFFPILPGWGLLLLDRLRERLLHTSTVELVVDAAAPAVAGAAAPPTAIFEESGSHKPTAVGLSIARPAGFNVPASGQWLYLQVPSIDSVWHPFSLASSSLDDTLDLQIGVRGSWPDQAADSVDDWKMPAKQATWTYKLMDQVRQSGKRSARTGRREAIKARVQGPYGSPFSKIFDAAFPAAVVIGAGTGLTSALSVLKEVLQRRSRALSTGETVPRHVWFVWACRHETDLDWCWRTLQLALHDAVAKGALQIGDDWNPLTSNMLDWLGITIYATRTSNAKLESKLGEMISPGEELYGAVQRQQSGLDAATGMMDNPMLQPKPPSARAAPQLTGDMFADSSDEEDYEQVELQPPRRAAGRSGRQPAGQPAGRSSYVLPAYPEPAAMEPPAPPRPAAPKPGGGATTTTTAISAAGLELYGAPVAVGSTLRRPERDAAESWDVGLMGRAEAQRLLLESPAAVPGDFVVRRSDDPAQPHPVLSYLVDLGQGGVFQHDQLILDAGTGCYTLQSRPLATACHTVGEVVRHLAATKDHTPVLLQLKASAAGGFLKTGTLGRGGADTRKDAVLLRHGDVESEEHVLEHLTARKRARTAAKIRTWLEEQVITAAIDDKSAPIGRLLKWVRKVVDTDAAAAPAPMARKLSTASVKSGKGASKIAVCFCGPPGLAHTLSTTVGNVGAEMEFSAHSQ